MRRISILGATGSIGSSTLDVVSRHPDRFTIHALTANKAVDDMLRLCLKFRPSLVCMADHQAARELNKRLRDNGEAAHVLSGREGLVTVAADPGADCVVAAIVGAAGLQSSMAAANAGKRILLANKEALVMAGPIFMSAVRRSGAELLPIDSEHNAIFQCLPPHSDSLRKKGVRKVILTASGGPFRQHMRNELENVTPDEACAHPNWVMGRKISVDSATMMNKALEIIEAHWLFDAEPYQIQVVIHPQSVIHSMVEYDDASVIAQLGNPDMRTPIAQALSYPDRIESGVASLDLVGIGKLEFHSPDHERFPALPLAYKALEEGGTAATIMNAANEMAVESFLKGQLSFLKITEVIEKTMHQLGSRSANSLDEILEADRMARKCASAFMN